MSAGAVDERKPGNVKAMNGVQEEERSDAFVEVVAAPAEVVELPAFFKERVEVGAPAKSIQREHCVGLPSPANDVCQAVHEDAPAPPSGQFTVGEKFEHLRQHLTSVPAVQGQCELSNQQAEGGAEIVAPALVLDGEVLFLAREYGERIDKGHARIGRVRQYPVQDFHHGRRKHVDAAKAEIVSGANAGDQETLFGFSGCRFFDHRVDAIEVAVLERRDGRRRSQNASEGSLA